MLRVIHSGGRSPARVASEVEINRILSKMSKKNAVLDIGAKNTRYENLLGATRFTSVDINPESKADVIADAHALPFNDETFDLILSIEVLEHLSNPKKAINEIYRCLNSRGEVILSTRFIFPYHPDPCDYFRFTPDSLSRLFNRFTAVDIRPAGNVLVSLTMILLNLLPLRLQKHRLVSWIGRIPTSRETKFACGYVVHAKK